MSHIISRNNVAVKRQRVHFRLGADFLQAQQITLPLRFALPNPAARAADAKRAIRRERKLVNQLGTRSRANCESMDGL